MKKTTGRCTARRSVSIPNALFRQHILIFFSGNSFPLRVPIQRYRQLLGCVIWIRGKSPCSGVVDFANFISGLIILFEQPVRVDDVVTVGDVTGTVTKIKIRATTIRKWDQTELIVPNKEFITGRLTNWTLTDKILRKDFIVGIAYGSDIKKAEQILYEIAAANPYVLDNPKPVVIFTSFGSSSLDFELRVYISGMENYLNIWHDINCAIDDAFRKAGIEIAFPQQDIHIRSVTANLPKDIEKMP